MIEMFLYLYNNVTGLDNHDFSQLKSERSGFFFSKTEKKIYLLKILFLYHN